MRTSDEKMSPTQKFYDIHNKLSQLFPKLASIQIASTALAETSTYIKMKDTFDLISSLINTDTYIFDEVLQSSLQQFSEDTDAFFRTHKDTHFDSESEKTFQDSELLIPAFISTHQDILFPAKNPMDNKTSILPCLEVFPTSSESLKRKQPSSPKSSSDNSTYLADKKEGTLTIIERFKELKDTLETFKKRNTFADETLQIKYLIATQTLEEFILHINTLAQSKTAEYTYQEIENFLKEMNDFATRLKNAYESAGNSASAKFIIDLIREDIAFIRDIRAAHYPEDFQKEKEKKQTSHSEIMGSAIDVETEITDGTTSLPSSFNNPTLFSPKKGQPETSTVSSATQAQTTATAATTTTSTTSTTTSTTSEFNPWSSFS